MQAAGHVVWLMFSLYTIRYVTSLQIKARYLQNVLRVLCTNISENFVFFSGSDNIMLWLLRDSQCGAVNSCEIHDDDLMSFSDNHYVY